MAHYNDDAFNSILSTSVSLSSIQSLCDLLQELPLPSSLYQQNCIINSIPYNNAVNSNSFGLIQSSLQAVKHQVNGLQLVNTAEDYALIQNNESSLISQCRRQHCFDEIYNNHNNIIEELKPSLEQQLEDDTTEMVINDLINDDYSSLGDRIKSNKRSVHKLNNSFENNTENRVVVENREEKRRKIDKQTSLEILLDEILSTKEEVSSIDVEYLPNLINSVSKMKHNNTLHQVSIGKLTELQNVITQQLCIWTANLESHFNHCCDLCLIALLIMTSSKMSQSIYHEECLEAIFNFISSSLSSIIAVSSSSSSKKSPKKKQQDQLVVSSFATKKQLQRWSELLLLLTQLLEIKQNGLNDSLIISLTRISFTAFFLNDNELQNNSIQLIDLIFSFYTKHRQSILEELLHQIARAPVSKKHQYDSSTSMFTALLLRLTQQLFIDKSEYDNSLRIISAFINSFMRKCCGLMNTANNQMINISNEHDLRSIFDLLITDISKSIYRPQWPGARILCHVIIKLCVSNLAPNKKNNNLQLRLSSIDQLSTICCQLTSYIGKKEKLIEEIYTSLKDISNFKSSKSAIDSQELLNESFYQLIKYLNDEKLAIQKKNYLLILSREMEENKFQALSNYLKEKTTNESEETIDDETCTNIIKYYDLVQLTNTQHLFDCSLSYLTASLSLTSNTTQRSRAMRGLSTILSTSPPQLATQLLARNDLQIAMRSALLDSSTSVREATIDLIGRFMLTSKQTILLDKYIDLICDRIMDSGISVRKRVIKILREVCSQYTEYARTGDLCSKILKRINDDGEGIRKLVIETFVSMWFKTNTDLSFKVKSLLNVVGIVLASNQSVELLTTLFDHIFKDSKDDIVDSSKQIIDHIINDVITNDEDKCSLVSAMTVLWLFARSFPLLLINHLTTLQPFLSLTCSSQLDVMLRIRVLATIEKAIHQQTNPSETLLSQLEEDLTKNILQCSSLVLQNSVSCLSTIIHKHTNNYQLIHDLFQRFSTLLTETTPKPRLMRALLTCGLFAKHFDLSAHRRLLLTSKLHSLISSNVDVDVNIKSLTALGYICHRAPQTMLEEDTKRLFLSILNKPNENSEYTITVLNSLRSYLCQEQSGLESAQTNWTEVSLKTMGSDTSEDQIQSTIIQQYLSSILSCTLSNQLPIRRCAVSLVHVIHSAGLVHPLQLVPHLVAMSTDDDANIRARADHVLNEIERKFHGFVGMQKKPSIILAYELNGNVNRGYRVDGNDQVISRLSTLYNVIAHNRQTRRALLQTLLKYVYDDEQVNNNNYLFARFIADNLVFLPYQLADEVLYLLHSFDTTTSLISSHVYALFKEILLIQDDDNEEDITKQLQPETFTVDVSRLSLLIGSLRIVYLITWLKQLLKELYSLSETKCSEYSPHEVAKVWDKPIHRKQFDARHINSLMNFPVPLISEDTTNIQQLVQEYSRFKSTSLSGAIPEWQAPATIIAVKLEKVAVSESNDQLSAEEQERLLDEIKKSSCFVRLDRIEVKNEKKKEGGEKKKKKKEKKKKRRVIIEDDEDDSDDSDDVDDCNYTDT